MNIPEAMTGAAGNATAPTAAPTVAAAAVPAAARRQPKQSVIDTPAGRSIVQALAVAAFLLLWELGARAGLVSPFLVGSPMQIFNALLKSAQSGALFIDTGYTLFAAILGFVLGTAAGSVLGLALWYSPFVARVIEPFIVSRLARHRPACNVTRTHRAASPWNI